MADPHVGKPTAAYSRGIAGKSAVEFWRVEVSAEQRASGMEWVIRLLHEEAEAMRVSVADVRWIEVDAGDAVLVLLVNGTERRQQFTEEDLEDVMASPDVQMRLRHTHVRQLLYRR